jgi:hypothetical protein
MGGVRVEKVKGFREGIRVRVEKGQGLEWEKGLELKGNGRGKE